MSSLLDAQAVNLLNMKTLAERLKFAMTEKGISQSELARQVAVSRGAVSLWLTGSTKELAGDNLLKVAQALSVSPMWLNSGRGGPRNGPIVKSVGETMEGFTAVRRVRIKLSAGISGYLTENIADDLPPILFTQAWCNQNGYRAEHLLAIQVHGSSMEPGLYQGDWVVINTADQEPKDSVVFAVNFEGEVVVKRIFRQADRWVAASDNADKRIYRDREIGDNTSLIGRVVHKQSERI